LAALSKSRISFADTIHNSLSLSVYFSCVTQSLNAQVKSRRSLFHNSLPGHFLS